jgi:hypothetical protein
MDAIQKITADQCDSAEPLQREPVIAACEFHGRALKNVDQPAVARALRHDDRG